MSYSSKVNVMLAKEALTVPSLERRKILAKKNRFSVVDNGHLYMTSLKLFSTITSLIASFRRMFVVVIIFSISL